MTTELGAGAAEEVTEGAAELEPVESELFAAVPVTGGPPPFGPPPPRAERKLKPVSIGGGGCGCFPLFPVSGGP